MSQLNNKILSDITVHMKYAKYIPELQRRETWEELVTRNMEMHIKQYPKLKEEINWLKTSDTRSLERTCRGDALRRLFFN